MFCSRGVTSRFRHLMEDVRKLLPHHKKEVKVHLAPPRAGCAAFLGKLLTCVALDCSWTPRRRCPTW